MLEHAAYMFSLNWRMKAFGVRLEFFKEYNYENTVIWTVL